MRHLAILRLWRQGNILDLAIHMERLNPDYNRDVRKVAVKLADHFNLDLGWDERTADTDGPETIIEAEQSLFPRAEEVSTKSGPSKTNEPLDFELKGLEFDHPYLRQRGFNTATIEHFGLGYCPPRGLMKGRVAIPLHDTAGRLVGYAGRIVDDAAISELHPKYKFPTDRQRLGIQYEFKKSALLYNAHRIKGPSDHLVVVEGFASVWWLHQMGILNTVALMGASCSPEQGTIILEKTMRDGYVFVLPDGDDAGVRCAESVFARVGGKRWVQRIELASRRQPTDCGFEELSKFFGV